MSILRSLRGMAAAFAVAACVLGTTTTASVAAADPTEVKVVRTSTGSGNERSKPFTLVSSYANAVLSFAFSSYAPTSKNNSGQFIVELFAAGAKTSLHDLLSPIYKAVVGPTSETSLPFSIGPGTYYLKLTTDTNGGKFLDATATATFGAPTPVPGPIAAAGLPGLLALAGYGLYRRRNRAA